MNKSGLFKVFPKRKTLVSVFCFIGFLATGAFPSRAGIETRPVSNIMIALQQKTVTLDLTNRSIKYILDEINRQADIDFLLRQENELNAELPSLSIKVTNASVAEALDRLLVNTNYTYVLDDNTIIILRRSERPATAGQAVRSFTLSGRVLNAEDGKAIVGASVVCVARNMGSISDVDGRFSIDVSVGDVLEISFMGMVTETYVVENDRPVTISLKNDVMQMDNVVVVGYGSVERESYTGNAVTVKRDELLKVSKTNVISALQAFDPSFRIQDNNRWGSDPNAIPEINIRGGSSLGNKQATFNSDGTMERTYLNKSNLETNPNLPTFIMDGFEISVSKLYDFDPNRIESVTILKDAAATAIYGSRAANGVVVITTVAPKPGELSVTYNFLAELAAPDLSDYNLLNAREKLEVERIAGCYIPGRSNGFTIDQWNLTKEYNNKFANIQKGVDTYWLAKPLKTAFNHKHTLDVEGGADNLRFGVDVQYYGQDGVMKGSLRDRIGAGFFLQYNYKGLSFRNYISYSGTKSEESPYGNFSDYAKQLPYDTYMDDEGNIKPYLDAWEILSTARYINPLYEPSLKNFDRSNTDTFTNNLTINWNIADNLLWKNQLSLEKESYLSERFYDPQSFKNTIPLSPTVLSSGELRNNYRDGFRYNVTSFLSYFFTADKHDINAQAGFEAYESRSNDHSAFFRGFPSGSLSSVNYAQEQVGKTTYVDSKTRRVGFLTSLNYSYDNTYLLDLSMRLDGSSSFGSNKRMAPFWAVGAGINVHNYGFMKNSRVIDQLKIRGSYGQVGNAQFAAYESLMTYTMMNDDWYKTGYGAIVQAFGNHNLKWETTNTLDVGFELMMLRNMIYLQASFYNKKTIDTINDVSLPISTGFSTYKDNIGEVQNRGFEISFRLAAIQTNDMLLYIHGNIAQNNNKILKISDSMREYNKKVQDMYDQNYDSDTNVAMPLMQYREGGSQYSIWGVRSLGINPADGQEIFVQRNGQLTQTWNTLDQVIIGNMEPKGQGSLGANFTYKRFSVSCSFLYEFGGQRYNQTLVDKVENANVYSNNVDRRVLEERWQKPGDKAKYKALSETGRGGVNQTKPTSRFVQDYDMLSMQALEVSYDLPQNIVDKLNMKMARISAGMNDVFTLSSIEQERGIDYPYARNFHLSVRLSF